MRSTSYPAHTLNALLVITTLLFSNVYSAPETPTGLCINGSICAASPVTQQVGKFPGTNMDFYPGFVIWTTKGTSYSHIDEKWNKFLSGGRKTSYRPKGVYGGIHLQPAWKDFYKNPSKHPDSYDSSIPLADHTHPAYDWSELQTILDNSTAINEDGALVVLYPVEAERSPTWLKDSEGNAGSLYNYPPPHTPTATVPKYNDATVVDEIVTFHKALHDFLVDNNYIDKIMSIAISEVFLSNPAHTSLRNQFFAGVADRNIRVAKIWQKSNKFVTPFSIVSEPLRTHLWNKVDQEEANNSDFRLGLSFPDMKLYSTDVNNMSSGNRFTNLDNVQQKDRRLLTQLTESNGHRTHTYFAPDIPNPWDYSGESFAQTTSHILWALSGSPKNKDNQDSGLDGQLGEIDPPGINPVHVVFVDWETTWGKNNPTVEEWQEAFDIFGPPGTFAFPYLPPGYQP